MANAMKWLMHVHHVRNFSVIFSCFLYFQIGLQQEHMQM